MAVIKKSELEAMDEKAKTAKIADLEKAMLELRGEGRADKIRPIRRAIAQLKTPRPTRVKKK